MIINNMEQPTKRMEIYILGDTHLPRGKHEKFRNVINEIKNNKYGYMIGLGDWVESIIATDPRYNPEEMANVIAQYGSPLNMIDEQWDLFEEIIKGLFDTSRVIGMHCLTPDHDVLTKNGWKNITKVRKGETVYSLNEKTKEIENDVVLDINSYNHNGNMIHYKHENLDTLVTPNHRIYHYKRQDYKRDDKLYVKTASELMDRFYIPVSGTFNDGKKIEELSNEECELIGWIIGDGTIRRDKRMNPEMVIYQTKQAGIKRIRQLLDTLQLKYSERDVKERKRERFDGGYITSLPSKVFTISRQHTEKYAKYITKGKILSKQILNSSQEQLYATFIGLILSEGNISHYGDFESYSFNTCDKNLLDQVQELCIKLNKRFKTNTRHRKSIFSNDDFTVYSLSITSRDRVYITKQQGNIKTKKYSGLVCCLTTNNNNFVVRRNGSHYITGNSGNHGSSYTRRNSMNMLKQICRRYKVKYLGDGFAVHNITYKGDKNLLLTFHGCGAGTTTGSAYSKLESFGRVLDDIDVIAVGHSHKLGVNISADRLKLNDTRLKQKIQYHCTCGSFLGNYDDGVASYAERKGYMPLPMGYVKVVIDRGEITEVKAIPV